MTTQFINPRREFGSTEALRAAFVYDFVPDTIPVSNLIDESVLAHVASLFAPSIEDDSWLLAMPARSSERWYDWIV